MTRAPWLDDLSVDAILAEFETLTCMGRLGSMVIKRLAGARVDM